MDARRAAVETLAPLFAAAAGELGLAEPGAPLRAAEQGRRPPRSSARSSRRSASRTSARGFSGHGPHLDEVAISLGGRAARRYASQGQQRSALLALLFAERDALLAERSEPPLMLLDDVTSELDPERRELLCERLTARRRAGARDSDRELAPARVVRARWSSRSAAALRSAASTARPRRRELARRGDQGPPRSLAAALEAVRARSRRRRSSAAVQEAWPDAAGTLAAAQGDPVSERSGVVTIACRSATWAQELDLMSPILLEKLGRGSSGPFSRRLGGPAIHRRRPRVAGGGSPRRSRRCGARSRRRRSWRRSRRRGPRRRARSRPRRAIRSSERGGVVTVACRSATWAQELDLMSPVLV